YYQPSHSIHHLHRHTPTSTLLPSTTLFRSPWPPSPAAKPSSSQQTTTPPRIPPKQSAIQPSRPPPPRPTWPQSPSITSSMATPRSEEHTSELQSRFDLVCRLLLDKKKNLR